MNHIKYIVNGPSLLTRRMPNQNVWKHMSVKNTIQYLLIKKPLFHLFNDFSMFHVTSKQRLFNLQAWHVNSYCMQKRARNVYRNKISTAANYTASLYTNRLCKQNTIFVYKRVLEVMECTGTIKGCVVQYMNAKHSVSVHSTMSSFTMQTNCI